MKVLIADDDPQLLRALRITLGANGYEVVTAGDGAEAVRVAVEEHPDLIMLDLGMPRLDGVEVIDAIRAWAETPILVVSGRTGTADKIEALDAGADDYVTKPFQIEELLARIRALTRRAPAPTSLTTSAFGDVVVDFPSRVVERSGSAVSLTSTEWRLLSLLVSLDGRVATREAITREIWGDRYPTSSSTLRFFVAQLRKKLEPVPEHPVHIVTSPGGYRFDAGRGRGAGG